MCPLFIHKHKLHIQHTQAASHLYFKVVEPMIARDYPNLVAPVSRHTRYVVIMYNYVQ